MEHNTPHIILQEVLNFEYSGNRNPLEVQELVHAWCMRQLMPCIETAFDELSDERSWLRLGKIEVNIDLTENEFAEGGSTSAEFIIKEAIQQAIAGSLVEKKTVTVSRSIHEVFIHFLESGVVPWQSSIRSTQHLVHEWAKILDELGRAEFDELATVLKHSSGRQRLISNISGELLPEVVNRILGNLELNTADLFLLLQDLAALFNDPVMVQSAYKRYLNVLLENIVKNGEPQIRHIVGFVFKDLSLTGINVNVVQSVFNKYDVEVPADMSQWEKANVVHDEVQPAFRKSDKEGIFIFDAGLILLNPFIPRFFDATGVVENNIFNSRPLAAALLHYCTTGKIEYGELELILPKILCGIHPSDPLEIVVNIPGVFREEAEQMLQAAIRHWEVLKDTSVAGFRETFLQREGRLRQLEDHWELSIAPGPFDMLLAQLPWSVEFVRLPWMDTHIHTRWGT